MGHAAKKLEKLYSIPEFRRIQEERPEKVEYFDGLIVIGMAGTRRYHGHIISNIIGSSYKRLRKRGCNIFPEKREVQTPDGRSIMQPDLVIQCSGAEAPNDLVAYDPVAIFEVLSPSTREHDRNLKFDYCSRIPALRHYVLVEQEFMEVEHRFRSAADSDWQIQWLRQPDERLVFPEASIDLSLAEIYEDLPF